MHRWKIHFNRTWSKLGTKVGKTCRRQVYKILLHIYVHLLVSLPLYYTGIYQYTTSSSSSSSSSPSSYSSSSWGATSSEKFWPSQRVSSFWSGFWCSPSVCYFHPCYIALYIIILPSILGFPNDLVSAGDHSYTFFLPCCYLAYDVRVRTKQIFVLWCSSWRFYLLPVSLFSSSFDLIRHVQSFSLVGPYFFLVPSSQIPLVWFLCFRLVPMFHRHMLPLVSLMFYTSVAWNSSSIVFF
jgi:hypothetical protein